MSHPPAPRRAQTARRPVPTAERDGGSALLVALVGVVTLAAVGVLVFVLFAQLAQETADEVAVEEVQEGALTMEVYEEVELGADKDEVLSDLRPALPVDTRVLDRYESRSPATVAAECVYYERSGGRAGESFRFCFDEDVLVDKTVVLAGDPGADSAVVEEGLD